MTRRARRQLSLITPAQAAEDGVSRSSIGSFVRSGRLEVLLPRVYGVVGAPDSWRRRVLAAVLACGDGAVASYLTAAYLHRFLDVRRPRRIEVLLPRGRAQRPPGIEVHTATELPDDHRTRIGPVPVTALDRTVCDIRADISVGHLRRIVHDLWRTGRTTPARIGSDPRCEAWVG